MSEQDRILAVYASLVACELVQSMPTNWRKQMSALLDSMTDYDSKLHAVSTAEIKNAVASLANHPESYC